MECPTIAEKKTQKIGFLKIAVLEIHYLSHNSVNFHSSFGEYKFETHSTTLS